MFLVLKMVKIVSLNCSYFAVNLFTKMSNFPFCFPSPRKRTIFVVVILSLVVVVFQLVYFQNSLTLQWRKRESRALDYVSEILTRYYSSKDSASSLKEKEDLMDSFGMRIQEIEFVGNYRFGGKTEDFEDLKNAIQKLKLNDGQKPEDGVPNPPQDGFNDSSSMDQMEAEKPTPSTRPTVRTAKRATKTFNTQKRKKKSHQIGFLNLHIWDFVCSEKTKSLKEFILYPSAPRYRLLVNKFKAEGPDMNDMGLRMFGFLHPKESGIYKFGISSVGTSELWLSNDTKSRNTKLVASMSPENEKNTNYSGNFNKFAGQISKPFTLKRGKKYFVEVVYKHKTGSYGVEVAWMKPGSQDFQVIPGRFLSLAVNDSQVPNNTVTVKDYHERKRIVKSLGVNHLLFMDFVDFEEAFPECEYQPSYYIKGKLPRYQGARNKSNTHFAEVYPPDQTNETLPLVMNDDIWWTENNYGNDVIDAETAMHVGKMFTRALENKYNGTFKVSKLMSLERVMDKVKGNRYHIQMEVEDVYSKRPYEFSEFLYQPRDAGYLCFPRGFRWTKQATVNVIVPLKNSGRWALYFIRNIADIVFETSDPHIHVIIIDYESTDIDVQAVLKKSSLSQYTVVKLPGKKKFNRAEALQKGADAVKDPHSILFFCDLHLKIPSNLIEIVRKHCVQGKMAFAPVVKRLKCGFYPELPFGYWERLGFGLIALFKSDFDRIGGMNVKEFKNWGGEDWELLDRVLESRMEVERLKIPSFYHFYHPGNSRIGA